MPPPAKAAEPEADVPEAKKGKGVKGILKGALGALVCIGLGLGAGWYQFGRKESAMDEALRLIERPSAAAKEEETTKGEGVMQKVAKPLPETTPFVTSYYEFEEPLTTNPAGSRRFLQIGVSLSTQYDATVMANVDLHKAALRSDMLAAIGSLTEEDIAGREGRELLAQVLRDAINTRLEQLEGFGGVEGVYFPSFVLQ